MPPEKNSPRPDAPPPSVYYDAEPEFDQACIKAIIELDPTGEAGLVKELHDTFVEDSSDKLARIRQLVETNDPAGIHALTHQLKSSAATLGLARLSRISRLIDDDARKGGMERARALVAPLGEAVVAGQAWLARQVPR